MQTLHGNRIAVLATDGFEQSELEYPVAHLREAGAEVHIVSLKSGQIKGWDAKDWGKPVNVDRTLDAADPADYDALVLPGGQMNPDILRIEPAAIVFIQAFWSAGKVVGAICHAPWLLIEAGIATGRKVTAWPSLRTDLENAGAIFQDAEVVTDQGLVTSRKPEDLPAFCKKLVEEITEGTHARAAA